MLILAQESSLYFSLEKLINFSGNRYELAKACMEYAKKVRMLETDEYHSVGEKDALVALKALLDGKIKYTMDETDIDDLEDMDDFEPSTTSMIAPIDEEDEE